jgi:glycosyltransferase involved in cell wall biosynthesis
LARLGVPYLVDYDDATFHRYDRHRFWLVRRLLGHRLDGLIRGAEIVTACNAYLADYARAAGAKRVMLLPTVVDLEWYRVRPEPAADELRVGWIGSPSTARYLGVVKRPLEVLSGERPVRLVVIGASDIPDIGVPVERHLWSEATEAALLADVHLGIMPLLDGDWERGKCGYKLIQHMACGRPVIASPVGVNTEIVGAETGYLADDEEQWLQALRSLAAEPGRRREQGLAARRVVEAKYSLQVHAPTVVTLFSRLAAAARGRRRYGFEPGNGS